MWHADNFRAVFCSGYLDVHPTASFIQENVRVISQQSPVLLRAVSSQRLAVHHTSPLILDPPPPPSPGSAWWSRTLQLPPSIAASPAVTQPIHCRPWARLWSASHAAQWTSALSPSSSSAGLYACGPWDKVSVKSLYDQSQLGGSDGDLVLFKVCSCVFLAGLFFMSKTIYKETHPLP